MSKSAVLSTFSVILLAFLGLRLFQLQVLEHEKYSTLAKNNTTRVSVTRAPRGIVYDRNGKILATNKQSLSVVVYPGILRSNKEKRQVAKTLCKILDVQFSDLITIFRKMDPLTPLPLTVDNDIDIKQAIQIFENYQKLPGVAVQKQAIRFYPYREVGSHFIGYVGQSNKRELSSNKFKGLNLGDLVGKDGLEKVFDNKLRGINGEGRIAVDRFGRTLTAAHVNKKSIKQAEKGADLFLTIDIDLQTIAEEAMGDMPGAVVAMDPRNGEILALVSKPGFDPNLFTKPIPSKVYSELNNKKAFLNRALSAYPPGSIWKPLTSLAALENGVVTPGEKFAVSGSISFGGFRFGDWTDKADIMDMATALAWSRDTYYYQVAKRMKPEWIADIGFALGAGKKTGVELLGEHKGIVPSPEWKKKQMKQEWFPGNTLHYSIGQSFLLATPLQAAKWASAIANNGMVPTLHLVKDKKKEKPERVVKLKKEENWEAVKKGMRQCIDSATGAVSRLENVILAGKTGSAEVHGYSKTHGWFIAFGPAGKEEEPELVVAVLGEGAGHGGSVAAPVAKKIFTKYFEDFNTIGDNGTERSTTDT